jgi:uncharacterized protein YecE (DUF72 family)
MEASISHVHDLYGFVLFVGTAGWSVPQDFLSGGSHLHRYAQLLNAVEINSSFHRPHRQATYARWANATPDGFRFSVKLPKTISHKSRLVNCSDQLGELASQISGLREKLGVLLLQLPPSHAFDPIVTEAFLNAYSELFALPLVIEPRNASWFDETVDRWLSKRRIVRAAADPAITPVAGMPGGWRGYSYFRWHGSPRRYYSSYDAVALEHLRQRLNHAREPAWCVFDNTASGAAFGNALTIARS